MKSKKLFIWLLLCLAIAAGCSSNMPNDFFIQEKNIEPEYEYLADIFVVKEGYYFLWFIPFASNSQEVASALMARRAKHEFPNADGIFDLHVDKKESVGLFRWAPEIVIKGKIARKRQ